MKTRNLALLITMALGFAQSSAFAVLSCPGGKVFTNQCKVESCGPPTPAVMCPPGKSISCTHPAHPTCAATGIAPNGSAGGAAGSSSMGHCPVLQRMHLVAGQNPDTEAKRYCEKMPNCAPNKPAFVGSVAANSTTAAYKVYDITCKHKK